MSKARLVIISVVEGRSRAEGARAYGVAKGWVSKLIARYRLVGEAAFEHRSRRPLRSPRRLREELIDTIIALRHELSEQGLDAGASTIAWHLTQRHEVTVGAATITRYLARAGLIKAQPRKRPRSSYVRFAASMRNETWQSDFTQVRLATGKDARSSWLDDCSRYALSVTAHQAVTGLLVLASFRAAITRHGTPAATLTDNGMVYTTRFSGGRGGRSALEHELRQLEVEQENSRPNHSTTCGKVERFQQTLGASTETGITLHKLKSHATDTQPPPNHKSTLSDARTTYAPDTRPNHGTGSPGISSGTSGFIKDAPPSAAMI